MTGNGYSTLRRILQHEDIERFHRDWIQTRRCPLWHPAMFEWILQHFQPAQKMYDYLCTYLSHVHYDKNVSLDTHVLSNMRNRHLSQWQLDEPAAVTVQSYLPNIHHLIFQSYEWTLSDVQQLMDRCPSVSIITLVYPFYSQSWIQLFHETTVEMHLLNMNQVFLFSFSPFSSLSSFSHLDSLTVQFADFASDELNQWSKIPWPPHLRHLSLLHTQIHPLHVDDFQLDLRSLHSLLSFQWTELTYEYHGLQVLRHCLLPSQLQSFSYRTDLLFYYSRESRSLQELFVPSSLSSLDLSGGVEFNPSNLRYLFQLHLSLTSLSLWVDTSGFTDTMQTQWTDFATVSCSNLHTFGIQCLEMPSWFFQWIRQLPSLRHLTVDSAAQEIQWIQLLQHTCLYSFTCLRLSYSYARNAAPQFSNAFFETIATSSLASLVLPFQRLVASHIHRLLPSRHLLHVKSHSQMTKARQELDWRCIQNQVHLDAWKRICFLLVWMRANHDNGLQDSGLDWVRSDYWEYPCNVLSQFMRES